MNHKGAKHFTLNDRYTLERMLKKGFSKPDIAEALGKCRSSIYYEINRGLCVQRTTDLIDVEVYCADVAHQRYKKYLKEKGPEVKIGHDHALVKRLEELIVDQHFSPGAAIASPQSPFWNLVHPSPAPVPAGRSSANCPVRFFGGCPFW